MTAREHWPLDKPLKYTGLLGEAFIPEKERYERALGKLAMRASLLHVVIEDIAWKIWGIHPDYRSLITVDLPLKPLIGKLQQTVKISGWKKELRISLKQLLSVSEALYERRNELLHALWVIRDGKPTFCYRRKNKLNYLAPSVSNIERLATLLGQTSFEIMAFDEEHGHEIQSPTAGAAQLPKAPD